MTRTQTTTVDQGVDLDQLQTAIDGLNRLLSDREPGLWAWQEQLANAQRALLQVILTPEEFGRLTNK